MSPENDNARPRGGLALGIDLGTTAVKVAVLDGEGNVVGFGSAPTRLITAPGGLIEQDVEEMWQSVAQALRQALGDVPTGGRVRAIGVSSQGGTLVLLDGARAPLGNAISWMDSRPARLGEGILCGRDDAFFRERTGWSLIGGALPLAQMLRLRTEDREALGRTAHVRFIDSYFVERLTGRGVTNPSDAAITMLYNVREERWDEEILELAGISADMLPTVVPSGTPVGPLRGEVAQELGLPAEATVVAGAHDQYCAAFGAGCRRAGDTIVSCGTAWVVLTMTDGPRCDCAGRLAPARAVTGDLWGLMATCPTAGASVDWLRRAASPGGAPIPFEKLEAAAAATGPSADGAVFVPPGVGSARDGRFVGLGMHHGFGHLARAVLEGAAMSACTLLERMKGAGAAPLALRAVGGATRSLPWMQILADVTGLPLEVAAVQEAASFGAARLAAESTGVIPKDAAWPEPSVRVEPDESLRATYEELFARFKQAGD